MKGEGKVERFDKLLRGMDLEFFGTGSHKISIEKALEMHSKGEALILDIRSRKENRLLSLGFAKSIPANEIPDRLGEIPKDLTIAILCTSSVRASVVYAYLLLNGYEKARVMTEGLRDIAGTLKPGYVRKYIMNPEDEVE